MHAHAHTHTLTNAIGKQFLSTLVQPDVRNILDTSCDILHYQQGMSCVLFWLARAVQKNGLVTLSASYGIFIVMSL